MAEYARMGNGILDMRHAKWAFCGKQDIERPLSPNIDRALLLVY
jgi:hypothetical protein